MSLQDLRAHALQNQALYYRPNERERGRRWTTEETMLGFVADVGDLAKLVMAAEGARTMPGGRAAFAHELADCLWSVLILANAYQIDLAEKFLTAMVQLENGISARLDTSQPGAV